MNVSPFMVIGIEVRTSNTNGQGVKDIGNLWNRFLGDDILSRIPNKIDNTVYCLYTEYEGDHTQQYTTVLGCKVENLETIPEGMVGKSFESGSYTKFTTRGNLSENLIANEWFKIWNMDLDRSYTVDFEVFGEKAHNPKDAEIDIFIGIK